MRRVLVIAALTLLLSSCNDDFEQAAVTDVGGRLLVVFHPCSWQHSVESVRLLEPIGQILGDADDPVLWEVTDGGEASASEVVVFAPGTNTPGYTETVPLDAPEAGTEVGIYLTTPNGEGFGLTFPWGSLRDGVFVTDSGEMSRDEWLEYAEGGC